MITLQFTREQVKSMIEGACETEDVDLFTVLVSALHDSISEIKLDVTWNQNVNVVFATGEESYEVNGEDALFEFGEALIDKGWTWHPKRRNVLVPPATTQA